MMNMIQESTGKGKKNKPVDVVMLQLLFNKFEIAKIKRAAAMLANSPAPTTPAATVEYVLVKDTKETDIEKLPKLSIDGTSTTKLSERIEAYQKAKKMTIIDGWIGKGGTTIKALMSDAGITPGTTRMTFIRKKIVSPLGVNSIKVDGVTTLYEKQFSALSAANKEGFKYILKTAKADTDLTSIPELAYMLATTKHETAHTFRGIGEYGKGAGKTYGNEITVTDTKTKKVYKNKYYGRGYVQITWGYNYQRIDHKLGHGSYPNKDKTKVADYNKGFTISAPTKSIYLNPEKALDKENAYVGLVWGMQKGIFTGKKISNYVNATKVDYVNARRVINGTDKANKIANYAENLEIILRTSTK